MRHSSEVTHLRNILELCKAGSCVPVQAMEKIIAGDAGIEPHLMDLLTSRALQDEAWGPLWAVIALGERKSMQALPAVLHAMEHGNDLIHEAVEFALLRYGPAIVPALLNHLEEHPGLDGRVHLYSVLARSKDAKALDYLIAQLRRDEDCMAGVAWSLAETKEPRAIAALEAITARFGKRDPDLKEALEAALSKEPVENPLMEDWRQHWQWLDDEDAPEEGEGDEDEPVTNEPDPESESPAFMPRCFDVDCPACHSQLEYDASDGRTRVVRGAAPRKQGRK